MFGRPLLSASSTHSSEYPLPLNTILWYFVKSSLILSWIARSRFSAFSNSSQTSFIASAVIVLRTTLAGAIESAEPTILNSNLLPVKANGDVLFLSVASLARSGNVDAPVFNLPFWIELVASPLSISCITTSSNCSPRNIEIIAGGASLAPNLWSLPTLEADSLKRSECSLTAFMIHPRTNKNWIFWWGVLPGSNKFTPLSVVRDQLLCLPEPLTPANGFSCKRHTRLCL